MKNKNHVITRTNRAECGAVCQNDRLSAGHIWQTRSHVYGEVKCQAEVRSDVVIHNKLDNGETCQGLLRRFVHKITNNNEISPHNDMIIKTVTNLFPYFPIPKKLRRFRIISWIIGGSAGSTQPSPGRATLSFRSCQNPQSGMTFIKQLAFTLAESATHVDLSPTKVKFAFTLAEVLITLGIIGIVAAMTIPNLITTHQQKVTSAKLRKAVSTLNQAIKMSESENGEMETWDKSLSYEDFINKYFRPYIKISMTCYPMTKCGYPEGRTHFKGLGGQSNWGFTNANHGGRTPFIDMDGILYAFSFFLNGSVYQMNENDKIIIIDVNASQPPNTYGKDVFFLYRIEEADSIVPYGAGLPQETIMQNCSKTGPGTYCAALIKQNGWEFPKGYPWK